MELQAQAKAVGVTQGTHHRRNLDKAISSPSALGVSLLPHSKTLSLGGTFGGHPFIFF